MTHEIRYALRLLSRQPLVTATAVLTVALAVGANSALYSVLETMLLRPLGIANAERIVWATVHLDKLKMRRAEASGTEYGELRGMKDTFEVVSAMEGRAWTAMFGGEPVRLLGRAVTPEYFRVFALQPAIGRFFSDADDSTLVISHALWRQQFGSAPDVLGRVLDLDGKPHRIIGVAPADFQVPANAQAWSLLSINSARMQRRGYNMNLTLYARLKDGVGAKQAMGRVNSYLSGLLADPAGKELKELQYGIDLEPFSTHVAGDMKESLWILWAAAITLLITGCANVAGLLLSRTSQRRR
ncbi:MAG: ABC transporter permease, partial [Bryobacterales bacterium]|nr:ABC transporter permease [Bryobacterales bacterium]